MAETVAHYVEQFQFDQSQDPITLLIKKWFPGVDCSYAGYVLWNETAYPFTENLDLYNRQLCEAAVRGRLLEAIVGFEFPEWMPGPPIPRWWEW